MTAYYREFGDAPLVGLQLSIPNREHVRQGMVVLANLVVPVADIARDPTPTDKVRRIVGVREREAFQDPGLGFDQVELRRGGGREHRMHPQPAQARLELASFVVLTRRSRIPPGQTGMYGDVKD